MISVHRDFVEDALETRYDDVVDTWGDTASKSLWTPFLDMLLEAQELTGTVNEIVDNFLVNGDFVKRETDQTEAEWERYCANNALVYNAEYAYL